jgi:asparagine synthase (glutamine-hydrolysing)
MCGIVGSFGEKVDANWVMSETDHLERRGPDHKSILEINSKLIMGATRLAMTDPHPRSNQPFARTDLNATITFNGEIYNYKELRSELSQAGYIFNTDSDTEVLLIALHCFGTEATKKINGMYSFAFYSDESKQLILGRDSLGKKPLYLLTLGNTLHWSSSLRSLANLKKNRQLSSEGLIQYLSFGYTIDPATIEQEISALSPGTLHCSTINGSNLACRVLISESYLPDDFSQLGNIREEIKKAVKVRISEHNSIAISMSGGLDSSIVAKIAAELDVQATAYSAIWPDSDKSRYNTDAAVAKIVTSNLGIPCKFVEMISTSNLAETIDGFVTSMEEPNSNPTGISMMSLYKAIRQDGHRLVLTGDGSDEIFGGYPRYNAQSRIPKVLNLRGDLLSRVLSSERTSASNFFISALLSQTENRNFHRWAHWHWNFSPSEVSNLLIANPGITLVSQQLSKLFLGNMYENSKNRVDQMMKTDRDIWLAMESNRKLDRISMYNSIEARSPFQDERVIMAGLNAMANSKFKSIEKKILWEAFPEMLSLGVRTDKTGFISPVGHWLRGNPQLATASVEHLNSLELLNMKPMRQLLSAPNEGDYRKIMQLWSLIILSRWIMSK